ncbi:MAG: choice-of-anchor Q domain-containing protein [Solirubrobacteraceae bacterium]
MQLAGTVDVVSSILANSIGGGQCRGSLGGDASLIQAPQGCAVPAGTLSADPQIGAGVADNGGPTRTVAPFPGSPVIGAGSNPSALAADQRGPGFARTLLGQTDIGAIQAPRVDAGPDQAVTLPATAALAGTVLSGGAALWTADSGPGPVAFANPGAASTSAAFSAAGTYVLRLSSTKPGGFADTVTVTVAASPPPPPPPPPAKVTLTGLSLSPATFAAASASTPVAAAARGTTVRWTLSRDAVTTITFSKRTTRPPRAGRKPVRRLVRSGTAGANTLRFTGRIAGSALSPGTWKLTITARDSDGNATAPQSRTFRIIAG